MGPNPKEAADLVILMKKSFMVTSFFCVCSVCTFPFSTYGPIGLIN